MIQITELINIYPKASLIIISILVTLIMTTVRYFVTDKELMRDIKQKQKWIREEMKKYKDNVEKMAELNQQMLEHFPAQMKQTMKLMAITFIPMIVLFGWLRKIYTPLIGGSWIWWYIGIAMVVGIVLSKILKLE